MAVGLSIVAPETEYKVEAIGTAFQAVRLSCLVSFEMKEEIAAYVCGIRIGQSRVEGRFKPGDIIEFPVDYLPWIELPTEIHLVGMRTSEDICPPIPLRTHEQAIALIGMGKTEIESLTVDQGMLRGLATNRVNGLIRPHMFARINGLVPRAISVEPPRLLDSGGASFQFAAQLHPADLVENGLTADIFMVGIETPLASIAYRRADVDDLSKRIVELEAQLAQSKTSTAFKFHTLNSDVTARMDVMQERIDTFIEYAASFMFDRVAAVEVQTQPGVEPMPPERRAKVDAFLDIVRHGVGVRTSAGAVAAEPETTVAVPLRSVEFSYGWYDVEEESGREFRWMAADAIVFNPAPDRLVKEVRVAVAAVYGADRPMIRGAFDTKPATVAILKGDRERGGPWIIRFTAPPGQTEINCQTLNLTSLLASSPARADGGHDSRMLSIAVTGITFEFAE